MVLYAQGSYPMVGSGMKLSFRMGVSGIVVPPSRFVPLRSFPPPACQRRGSFSRVPHARAGAPFAPARFARLIARAWTSAGRTSPVRSVGVFSRRREAGDEAARGCRLLLSHPTTVLQGSSRYKELIQLLFVHPRTQLQASGGSLDRLPRLLDMNAPGAGLADGNADRKGPAHTVLRQVDAALVIDRMQQPLVQLVDR